jgi:hypothetical protein
MICEQCKYSTNSSTVMHSLLWRVHPARRLAAAVPREKGGKLIGPKGCHTHALCLQVLQGAGYV